ncbi:MAG: ATP-binding protein, partial [Alphaproteobacteria bacterium]
LGLAPNLRLDLNGILARLRPEDASALNAAVHGLRRRGETFTLTLETRDGARALSASGARLSATSGGIVGDILWLRDITASVDRAARFAEERDRLRQMLDALPVPVWRRTPGLDIEDGNRAYAAAVELESVAAAVSAGQEVVTGLGPERGRALAERARSSRQAESASHHVVYAGARRMLEVTERPVDDEGHIVGYALDHTGVEERENERRRQDAANRELLRQLATAIVVFGPDTRVKFYNEAYLKMWRLDEGWLATEPTYSEVLERLRDQRMLPEYADFPAHKRERLKLFTSLIGSREEYLHLGDGKTLRMVTTPHPLGGLFFTFEDVTGRLALERSYNTLIEVQRETLNNLYEGVAVYGGDGRLKLWNPAFARIWRLPEQFLVGEPHLSDIMERTKQFFENGKTWGRRKERLIARATDRLPLSGRLDRVSGTVIDYAKVPLPDGAALWLYLDVTDSVRVERALRERNEALETADRLKSEFIANVSYELRTPLNAVSGFAEILHNQYFGPLNARQLEYSQGITEAAGRLAAIISDILDLAMIEAGRMTLEKDNLDLHALLVGVVNLSRDWARKQGLVLEFDCPRDIGRLIGDERRLKQAVFNLMSNAIKFTPEGGTVALSARRAGDEFLVTVADTGIGITREDRERIFGRFERGTGPGVRRGGIGIGLALVKKFTELHGGRVEIESGPGEGTRVTCHLPAPAA